MPREAAGRLATRLSAKTDIEEVERYDKTISQLIDELFKEATGRPLKRPRVSITEEVEKRWDVKHGPARSSLEGHPTNFARAFLTLKERQLLVAAREKIFWTHPDILARLRMISRPWKNPELLEQMNRKFSRGVTVKNPFLYYLGYSRHFLGRESRQINNLHDVADSLAYTEHGGEILSRLNELCKEISEERGREGVPVQFSIKVNAGTIKFPAIGSKKKAKTRRYFPKMSSIKVVFRRKR